jgi:signal transduction histidine kinase
MRTCERGDRTRPGRPWGAGRRASSPHPCQDLAAAVSSPRPLDAVLALVIDQISDVVPSDAAAVWLHDADNDLWYIGGARGLTRRASQISFQSGQTLHAQVGDQGEIVTNLHSVGFRRLYPEHDLIQGALYAPMKIAGRRVGLIALYRNDPAPFNEDDLGFVRTVGSHVGMAVSFAALEARAERLAVLDERARLGADLHDGILQILSSVRVYARELRSSLSKLEDCVDDGSEELIAAIGHLRTPDACLDLRRHLDVARDRLEERGVATSVESEVRKLDSEVADALGWIIREAASNIIKHSGATRARIEIRATGTEVEMTVADNGAGRGADDRPPDRFDERPLGHKIMRERAAHLGGVVSVSGGPEGTTVRARVPAVPMEANP